MLRASWFIPSRSKAVAGADAEHGALLPREANPRAQRLHSAYDEGDLEDALVGVESARYPESGE